MKNLIMAGWNKVSNFFSFRRPLVTVVRLTGTIGGIGGFRQGLTLAELTSVLDRAFEPSKLQAVAVVVNSPGGSPVQSALIANQIRMLADEKKIPVFTFAEDVAASGGYWLACAGDEIFAHQSSILGSIGVVSGGFGYTELIKKLGIERRLYTSGENKGMLDPFVPEKVSDVKHIKELQKEIHDDFKNMVRARRKDILKTNEKVIFSGAFWTGKRALELGLIDGIGDLHFTLRQKFGKTVKLRLIKQNESFLKKKLGLTKSISSDEHDFSSVVKLCQNLIGAFEERLTWQRFGL